jgi:hypothetical protein
MIRRLIAVFVAGLAVGSMLTLSNAAANDDVGARPPTTDFHTIVTEPGAGQPGGGGGTESDDQPHRPVCVWERGGGTEVDIVARNSGVGAAIIREDAQDHILLVYRCDGRWDGRTWRWAIPITADELARDGLVELAGLLPAPEPITTPPAGQSSIATVPVFVWTDPAAWTPFEVTRTDALTGLSATATATPMTMTFDPGDGTGALACNGPGLPYDPQLAGGDPTAQATMPGRCAHAYELLTRNVDGSPVAGRPPAWSAILSVDWEVMWLATNGQTGRFATITKATTFDRAVTEVQVLVTG